MPDLLIPVAKFRLTDQPEYGASFGIEIYGTISSNTTLGYLRLHVASYHTHQRFLGMSLSLCVFILFAIIKNSEAYLLSYFGHFPINIILFSRATHRKTTSTES